LSRPEQRQNSEAGKHVFAHVIARDMGQRGIKMRLGQLPQRCSVRAGGRAPSPEQVKRALREREKREEVPYPNRG
jgi:hypothetical protein